MAVSPLTLAGRAASSRFFVDNFPRLEGNPQMLLKMSTQDAVVVAALSVAVAGTASPPGGMATSLASQAAMLAKLPQWSGNINLWPLVYTASGNIWNACDFLDAAPANVPRNVGTTESIGIAASKPLVVLAAPFQPLDPAVVNGAAVRVEGSGWASLDGRSFTVEVVSVPGGQFRLVEANTTAETVAAKAATIWCPPT